MKPDKEKQDKDQKIRESVNTPHPPQRKDPNKGTEPQKKEKKKNS
ncbi:hypothetical protein BH23BAC1_BH23BAC1_34280 [soil metagenome]